MDLSEEDALVPIRMVEALTYCPRQAWYRFVQGDDPTNEHMERGLARHAIFALSEGDTGLPPGVRRYRNLWVMAPRLGVVGVLDEVDVGTEECCVTEYKTAKLRREVWPGVRLQLAVQVLALREHASSERWSGPPLPENVRLRVYLTDSRRYREIPWTEDLRIQAVRAVEQAKRILDLGSPPEGRVGPRCGECQHEPICLPLWTDIWRKEP
ncbi:MAG: CRISPR-associated protein Cas4 [Bacillota bacterium]|nr:CRISPR-associated protein Cas4 [Bacillota bacterium]